jgi:hypothetical protein
MILEREYEYEPQLGTLRRMSGQEPRPVGCLGVEPRTPRILGPLLWLVVDSDDYLRVSQLRTLIACGQMASVGAV